MAAVAAVEPGLTDDAVRAAIDATGIRGQRRLACHLQDHPDALRSGPNSAPPALGRFVQALVAAGAQRITLIHPVCADWLRPRASPAGPSAWTSWLQPNVFFRK